MESMELILWHAVMGNHGFGMVLVMICVLHGYPLGCFNGMGVVLASFRGHSLQLKAPDALIRHDI